MLFCLAGGKHQHRCEFDGAIGAGSGKDGLEEIVVGIGWIGEDAGARGAQGNIGEKTEKLGAAPFDDEKFTDAHFFDGHIAMETDFEALAEGTLNYGAKGVFGGHGQLKKGKLEVCRNVDGLGTRAGGGETLPGVDLGLGGVVGSGIAGDLASGGDRLGD